MNKDDQNDLETAHNMPEADPLTPVNNARKDNKARQTAVAIKSTTNTNKEGTSSTSPHITASGRGKIAEQIMDLAFENGVRVRQDKDLAELLTYLDQDTPIPSEALEAIAEILSYVYRANGQPNPFAAELKDAISDNDK